MKCLGASSSDERIRDTQANIWWRRLNDTSVGGQRGHVVEWDASRLTPFSIGRQQVSRGEVWGLGEAWGGTFQVDGDASAGLTLTFAVTWDHKTERAHQLARDFESTRARIVSADRAIAEKIGITSTDHSLRVTIDLTAEEARRLGTLVAN